MQKFTAICSLIALLPNLNLSVSAPVLADEKLVLPATARWRFANNYYLLAGLADANGNPGDPLDSFDSFFGDHEYFKHIELGWTGSWQSRSTDNIHLMVWQVEERTAAEVDEGWGLAVSFSQKLDDRWLPFLRIGYSDGGGALLDRSTRNFAIDDTTKEL